MVCRLSPRSLAAALVLGASACSRAPEQRQYEELTLRPQPPAAAAPANAPAAAPQGPLSAAAASSAMAGTVSGAAVSLAWTAPEGWREQPGSSVRLATFFAGPESAPAECSITAFPGDVGGTEANLRRWLGQLNAEPPAPEAFASFVKHAQSITTQGGLSGHLYDFADLLPDLPAEATSTLAAVLQVEGATVFVKMMGPKALLGQERERFTELCRSFKPSGGKSEGS